MACALGTARAPAVSAAEGGAPKPCGIEEAIGEALAHNASLQAAAARVDEAQAAARVADAIRHFAWRYEGAASGIVEQNIDPEYWFAHAELLTSVTTTLSDGGKSKADWLRAIAEVVVARAEYEKQASSLALAVVSAFFGVVGAEAELGAAREGCELVGEHLRMARARFAEGQGPELDVLRAEAALSQAQAAQVGAAAESASARRALAVLLGRPPSELVEVAEAPVGADETVADAELASAQARERAPEVRIGQAELALAQAGVEVARKTNKPDVGIVLSHTLGNDATDSRHVLQAGLRWGLPLGDHGERSARVDEGAARVRAAVALLEEASRQAEVAARDALGALAAARLRLEGLTRAAEVARTVHERATRGYADRAIAMRDLLDAREDLTAAERDRVRAQCDVAVQEARLRQVLGTLVSSSSVATSTAHEATDRRGRAY